MRGTLVLTLALAAVPLTGCIGLTDGEDDGSAAATVWSPAVPVFEDYIHSFADVVVGEGVDAFTVHMDIWQPDPGSYVGTDPTGAEAKTPVVVDMGPYFGWGKQGPDRRVGHYIHDWVFDHMIPRGYAFAAVEQPGSAGSTGCWDFMGPQEQAAAGAAVDYLGSQEWSNGKVGMIGKSYDGMTQIQALAEHPEHLATVVPVAPLTHAYAGVYMNGVPYTGFWGGAQASYIVLNGLADIPVHTPERVPGSIERVPATALCTPDNVVGGMANLGDYNEYYKERDFRASAATIDVPVFFMQGFLDRNVRADNAFPYVNDLPGDKLVWLGQWAHDYANASYAGRTDMYLTLQRWFDHYLMGLETGIDEELGFVVQDSEGRWRREASWPPADTKDVTFQLADGELVVEGTGSGAAFLDDGRVAPVSLPAAPYGAAYLSDPLDAAMHIAGPVRLDLHVASSGVRGQLVAMVFDCDANHDDCDRVSLGAMNLVHRNGLERAEPLTPNEMVQVSFTLQPRDYVVDEGRTLVLYVAGTDGDWFMPEPTRNVITIGESEAHPSSITVPLVERGEGTVLFTACGVRIRDKDCFEPGREDLYPDA